MYEEQAHDVIWNDIYIYPCLMSNFISASPRLSLEQNNPISFLQRFSIIFLYELAIHIFYKT